MKGIVLAGGSGTRLYPMTRVTSKQLLPVYDKPMIYYPLSVLMRAGIRDILVITTPEDSQQFRNLLGTGENFGIRLSYAEQPFPEGLAQALIIGEIFLAGDRSVLILGDNVFYGDGLDGPLRQAVTREVGATLFAFPVEDPWRFGVVELDDQGNPVTLEEKPVLPKSDLALTGLYVYDGQAPALARTLAPSPRGELEITDLNRLYLDRGTLAVEVLDREVYWLDTGTVDALAEAAERVRDRQKETGRGLAVLEEIAFGQGWIDRETLGRAAQAHGRSPYGDRLRALLDSGQPEGLFCPAP